MSTGVVFAQKISLFELQNIFANKTFDSTNKLLLSKNFEFSKTEKTEDNKIAISWNFDQNNEDKLKTLASFKIISLDGVIQKAAYEFRGKEIYANILGDLTKFEFQTDKEEIENEMFTISYSNSSFYMKISFKKSIDESENLNNSYISYMINISKKGGADDPHNGLKTDFFLNGKPKSEYTLKDGKMNGVKNILTRMVQFQKLD
jgi:antitoxin component YwqK of YwqJK toxin-antitoxin module